MHPEAERRGRHRDRLRGGQGERRRPERSRVQAEHEVMHDRVPHQADLEHVDRVDVGLGGQLDDHRGERLADDRGELGVAAGMHHHVGHPAHQVLAEADLRVHPAGRGEHLSGEQVAQVAGERGGADVEGHAVQPVAQARPDRDHVPPRPDRHRDAALATLERRLQGGQHGVVDLQRGELPLLGERRPQPLQVADRVHHRRLVHLDVVQREHRVDRHLQATGVLAHHLAVHLAGLRDVDHDVVEDLRRTPQPSAGRERPSAGVAELGASTAH